MNIRFWGTRGSIPSSINKSTIRNKVRTALKKAQSFDLSSDEKLDNFIENELPFSITKTYGSNTSCVEIEPTAENPYYIFCDAGSGLSDFSYSFKRQNTENKPATFHFFISHLHWDHIQGFPFFEPAYNPNNEIIIHACHPETEEAFRKQMSNPFFPVDFSDLKAKITFDIKKPNTPFTLNNITVHSLEQVHPGNSYAYRFDFSNGKKIIYATDAEHTEETLDPNSPFSLFSLNADILIFDAMYSLSDAIQFKVNWGHSSNILAAEIAKRSQIKHLILFHNDPISDDATLDKFLDSTRKYVEFINREEDEPHFPEKVSLAHDGLLVSV